MRLVSAELINRSVSLRISAEVFVERESAFPVAWNPLEKSNSEKQNPTMNVAKAIKKTFSFLINHQQI